MTISLSAHNMIILPTDHHPAIPSPGAAIYVDTENLRDSDHAQNIVAQIVADWPGPLPLGSVSLYVRADKIAVWEMWAESSYPDLRVRVRGVQHFSNNRAKNSADLAITADAVADLVTSQAAAVAVVSNDSDFGALFVKIKEMARSAGLEHTPFLWITSPDAGALSSEMERFIPDAMRWDLSATPAVPVAAVDEPAPKPLPEAARPALPAANGDNPGNETIADQLIRRLDVGKFKVTDAHDVFQELWPRHPAAAGPAQFGTFLLKAVWPILQKRGVLMTRKSSPRTYEITQAAKESITGPQPQPTSQTKTDADSTPAQPARSVEVGDQLTPRQLAAAVATDITDDLFKASDAQSALKQLHPQHPAASYTAAQFGTWFARQLWPIMEGHGVVLASEKPRRYEMTPDARHRLTNLS